MTMKSVLRQLILLLVGCLPNIAFSAEKMDVATDSIASDTLASSVVLEDVVVKSDMVVNIKNGIAYYPTEAIKKIAFGIIDVMRMLPLTTAHIKDGVLYSNGTNEAAVYFIDGVQATGQDLNLLLPRDIKRVEVLQNPSEAQFMSNGFVVNITTKKVILGGYGKLNGYNSILSKIGRYNVAAKAVARKSEFIVNGEYSYRDVEGGKSREKISYDFPVLSASTPNQHVKSVGNKSLRYLLDRESETTASGDKNYIAGVAFQWRYYSDERTRYLLSGGYKVWDEPSHYSSGLNKTTLMLPGAESPIDSITAFHQESAARMIASAVDFDFVRLLSSGIFINATASLNYTYRNGTSNYLSNTEVDVVDGIFNKSKQNSLSPNLSFYINIPFRKSNGLSVQLSAFEKFYDMKRSGTANVTTNQRESYYSVFVGYKQDLNIKNDIFSYTAMLTLPIDHFKYTDSHSETMLQYDGAIRFNYSHKQLFTLSGSLSARQLSRPSFFYSGISIQETDISGDVDNLDVGAPREYNGTINVSFKLGKKFFVGGYFTHLYSPNAIVRDYFLKDNIVYSLMVNGGKWHKSNMRITGSLRLLDNNLGFDIRAGFNRSNRADIPGSDLWSPQGEISAFYANNKGWGATVEYTHPMGKMHTGNALSVYEWCDPTLSASFSYNHKNLSLKLSVHNIDSRWLKTKSYLNSDNVHINGTSMRLNDSQLRVTIIYILDFGRRYSHDAEGVNPAKANIL